MVYSSASWGEWGQTIEEVYVEINVPEGTSPKNIHCNFKPKSLLVTVNGNEIIKVYVSTCIFNNFASVKKGLSLLTL